VKRAAPLTIISSLLLMSCKMPGETPDFSKLTEDFVYRSLALTPVTATAAGYHEYRGERLDNKLDDYSRDGVISQIQFYRDFDNRLQAIKPEALSPEERAERPRTSATPISSPGCAVSRCCWSRPAKTCRMRPRPGTGWPVKRTTATSL
jgi:hypothetical protein